MIPLHILTKRLRRLPRQHRIAHLRSLIPAYPERSIRRQELELMLRDEMLGQLKKENLDHRTTAPVSTPNGHQKAEVA
jgi:hypothetical protein